MEFLGIEICTSGGGLSVRISEKRRTDLRDRVNAAIAGDSLTKAEAASLAGKLSFAQFHTFGKFGRAYLVQLYRRAASGMGALGGRLREDLVWWSAFLAESKPRVAGRRKPYPDWVVYTDAAGDGGLGAIACRAKGGIALSTEAYTSRADTSGVAAAEQTNLIYGLEVLAVKWCLDIIGPRLEGG